MEAISVRLINKRCPDCGQISYAPAGPCTIIILGKPCGGDARCIDDDTSIVAIVDPGDHHDDDLDAHLLEAVTRGFTVEEDGSTGTSRHQYRPVEVGIEIKVVRTWRLEYVEQESEE